jgi:membrane protein implicated in regulation of membrane protease activity
MAGDFFGLKPFISKYVRSRRGPGNVYALIGKTGRVTEPVDNLKNEGRVLIDGVEWKAKSPTNEILSLGENVEVLTAYGTVVIVKRTPLKLKR